MRAAFITGALFGLAIAGPLAKRQGIDFDLIDAAAPVELTTPPTDAHAFPGDYDSDAAAADAASNPVTDSAKKLKRDADCSKQPAGYGPKTSPDTDSDFLANPQYTSIANDAQTPQGYDLVFGGLNAASRSPSYITYKQLKKYDTIACQQFCDSVDACYFFNVFLERAPSLFPAKACANPPSTVYYKCSLFGAQLTQDTADNAGQWRNDFHVVIAGSNGYAKQAAPPAQDGFTGPVQFGGAIESFDDTYMGARYFSGPYDPSQCASVCEATTAYNSRHPKSDGTYRSCNFFNSYVLSKNNVAQGTYCAMYTVSWGKDHSTNIGQYRGSDYYSVSQSYGYTVVNGVPAAT